jgi:hypothetical protein
MKRAPRYQRDARPKRSEPNPMKPILHHPGDAREHIPQVPAPRHSDENADCGATERVPEPDGPACPPGLDDLRCLVCLRAIDLTGARPDCNPADLAQAVRELSDHGVNAALAAAARGSADWFRMALLPIEHWSYIPDWCE